VETGNASRELSLMLGLEIKSGTSLHALLAYRIDRKARAATRINPTINSEETARWREATARRGVSPVERCNGNAQQGDYQDRERSVIGPSCTTERLL
jgi:hypothetical protein